MKQADKHSELNERSNISDPGIPEQVPDKYVGTGYTTSDLNKN